MSSLWNESEGMNQMVERMQGKSLEDIYSTIRDKRRPVANRFAAMVVLSRKAKDDSQLRQWLLASISDAEPMISGKAIQGLGELKDRNCIPPLMAMVGHGDAYVRSCAIIALGKVKDKAVLSTLTAALNDGDEDVRAAAIVALGQDATSEAMDSLHIALNAEAIWRNRVLAACELARNGSEAGLPILEETVRDETDERGPMAAATLMLLGHRSGYEAALRILEMGCVTNKRLLLVALNKMLSQSDSVPLQEERDAREWLIKNLQALDE